MKVYLAHNFKARVWLKDYIELLRLHGHECTSRWITDDAHVQEFDDDRSARVDLDDIDSADAIIMFTDQYGSSHGKGKFLELGYALAQKKICVLYGQDLNSSVFYRLREIAHAHTFQEALDLLSAKA